MHAGEGAVSHEWRGAPAQAAGSQERCGELACHALSDWVTLAAMREPSCSAHIEPVGMSVCMLPTPVLQCRNGLRV